MYAINLVSIKDLKAVFFDVDGVLSIPRYPLGPNGKIIAFAESERWNPFATGNIDAYKECHIPLAIKEWMDRLHAAGVPMYVLSVSDTGEEPSKLHFLEKNFEDYFTEIKLVPTASAKKEFMLEVQKQFGYEPFTMALVEDNHYTLCDIAKSGFMGIHVSWFLESSPSRW